MTPPKVRFLIPNKVLGSKKYQRGPKKMKKTVFLKKGQSYILPKIIYGISGPHGDLLHWNLSWASTFIFLSHEERGVQRNICFSNEWHDMTFLIARTDCLSQVAGNTKCGSSAIVLLLSSCVAGRRVAQHWSIYCIMCKWSLHWLTIRPNWHKIFGPRGNRSHTKVDFES